MIEKTANNSALYYNSEVAKTNYYNAFFIGVQNEDNKMATGKNITVKNEEGTVIGRWTVGDKTECSDT